MLRTINSRFILFTIIFILLIVGIPTGFLISQFRENFDQRSRIMLESTIDVVNNCLINAMHLGHTKNIQTILDNISRNESVDHIRLFKEDGRITYSSNHTQIGQYIQTIAPGHVNLNNINQNRITLIEEERIYSVTRPILNGKECQKCHGSDQIISYLDVDTNLTQAERFFHTGSLHMIFLAIVVILILFLGFYYLFNFFINKPLRRFKKALDNVENGKLDVHLPAKKPDEFGTLESHFNHMVLNLKESKEKIDELHFEQLQRADKLVTLGELAAEMAHEINNPAGIVMSRADFIQMRIEKNPELQKYNEDLEVIINQVNKISKITGNILKYSKKLPKDFQQIDLKKLSEESLDILEPRLLKNGIRIQKQFESSQTEIHGDQVQMEQVFTNLVNNAIDAIDHNGQLVLGLKDNGPGYIEWFLHDNGQGIDEKVKDKIFSPFFTTKPANKGTGLGLYIVKNICKNHNATISCESKSGEGATFRIIFSAIEG